MASATPSADDQNRIARATDPASLPAARLAAVEYLTDVALLERIAHDDADALVRQAAKQRADRLDLLAITARRAQVDTLVDAQALATVARGDRSFIVRARAAARLDDQATLAEIATGDASAEVRRAATARLLDQALRSEIACRDPDAEVRRIALSTIVNPELLARVAREAPPNDGLAAVRRLSDQPQLRQVWNGSADLHVRRAALAKLQDQALLSEVALHGADIETRLTAARALLDGESIARVLLNSSDPLVRSALLPRVRDPQVLAALARKETTAAIQRDLAARLSDSDALRTLALRSDDDFVLCRAIPAIDEPAALRQIAGAGVKRTPSPLSGLAGLKLLLLEPRVASRLARPMLACDASIEARPYRQVLAYGPGGFAATKVEGEVIKVSVLSDGRELIKREWAADFPERLPEPARPRRAKVDLVPFVLAFIEQARLSPPEVVELVLSSPAADMRSAAVAHSTDATLLKRVAATDASPTVRAAAARRLDAIGPPQRIE